MASHHSASCEEAVWTVWTEGVDMMLKFAQDLRWKFAKEQLLQTQVPGLLQKISQASQLFQSWEQMCGYEITTS